LFFHNLFTKKFIDNEIEPKKTLIQSAVYLLPKKAPSSPPSLFPPWTRPPLWESLPYSVSPDTAHDFKNIIQSYILIIKKTDHSHLALDLKWAPDENRGISPISVAHSDSAPQPNM
jgi:hypothetical protein